MARRKKDKSGDSVRVTLPTQRETLLKCHECGKSKTMAQILAIQNKGPICRECAGY
jgi:hypothetical protein